MVWATFWAIKKNSSGHPAWDKVEHVKVLIGHAEASELRIENSALRKGPHRDHV
jgi:hypothetical protein